MIQVNDVTKTFKHQTVYEHVSIQFEAGKIHGLIGKNGAGKTVFLRLLCGLMRPDSGTITIAGKQIGKDVDFAPDTGIIIESPGFLPYKSGYSNLKELASIRNIISKEEILRAMELVGLADVGKKPIGKYSYGMRQRLAIAQAIMEQPKLLLLDEPMNSLDSQGVEEMRRLFLRLKAEGTTILIASHSMEDIDLLCDTVHRVMDRSLMKL